MQLVHQRNSRLAISIVKKTPKTSDTFSRISFDSGSPPMRVQLEERSVIKASAQFWNEMLAMTLEPIAAPGNHSMGGRHMTGRVNLSGAWSGWIEVRMAEKLAREATAAMLMLPPDEVGLAETLDATKEIANITAGVIKSSLPRPCTMTVPEAAVEAEGFTVQLDAENSLVVVFRHPAGDLTVRVVEEQCPSCQ
jgi:CheY-specific phosphatase CheX